MWSTHELIVAPATVTGSGARGVVRFSGDGLDRLLHELFTAAAEDFPRSGEPPRLVVARLGARHLTGDWGPLPVEILHWPGPQGPTGGPLAEVQLPASGPLVEAVVGQACRSGARLARGGEFSLRGFLAGRLDLLQAEAVLAVVDARTPAELAAALDRMAGGVGLALAGLREMLLDLTADVEAMIDFADEHTPDAVPVSDAAARAMLETRLMAAGTALEAVAARLAGRDASAAADLPRAVLVGPPNIGKSSLFNRLVGREAALVADEAGTTRDWITARLDADPTEPACLLVDVAGVSGDRASGPEPIGDVCLIARAAAERAYAEIARADLVIACHDAAGVGAEPLPTLPAHVPRIDVLTRCDLGVSPADPRVRPMADRGQSRPTPDAAAVDPGHPRRFLRSTAWKKVMDDFFQGQQGQIATSSRTGEGIGRLRSAILGAVAHLPRGRTPATLRMQVGVATAIDAVEAARAAAQAARGDGSQDEAVVAGLLRQAIAAVGEVTGVEIASDLIDRIFSRHCIGK